MREGRDLRPAFQGENGIERNSSAESKQIGTVNAGNSPQARCNVGQFEKKESAVFVDESQEVQGKPIFEKQLGHAL